MSARNACTLEDKGSNNLSCTTATRGLEKKVRLIVLRDGRISAYTSCWVQRVELSKTWPKRTLSSVVITLLRIMDTKSYLGLPFMPLKCLCTRADLSRLPLTFCDLYDCRTCSGS